MTHDRRIRQRIASTIAALALLAGACGGGDDRAATTATTGNPKATGDRVAIEGFAYQPDGLRVEVGTTVTFTNKDGFAHTVTAKDESFDSGNLAEGADFEHTFDEAGTFAYFCAIHNSMTGTVAAG